MLYEDTVMSPVTTRSIVSIRPVFVSVPYLSYSCVIFQISKRIFSPCCIDMSYTRSRSVTARLRSHFTSEGQKFKLIVPRCIHAKWEDDRAIDGHLKIISLFWDNFAQMFTVLSADGYLSLVPYLQGHSHKSKIRNGSKTLEHLGKFDLVRWVLSL